MDNNVFDNERLEKQLKKVNNMKYLKMDKKFWQVCSLFSGLIASGLVSMAVIAWVISASRGDMDNYSWGWLIAGMAFLVVMVVCLFITFKISSAKADALQAKLHNLMNKSKAKTPVILVLLFCLSGCGEDFFKSKVKKPPVLTTTIGVKVNWELPVPGCSTCNMKSITQGTHNYLIYSVNGIPTMVHDPDCTHKAAQ